MKRMMLMYLAFIGIFSLCLAFGRAVDRVFAPSVAHADFDANGRSLERIAAALEQIAHQCRK